MDPNWFMYGAHATKYGQQYSKLDSIYGIVSMNVIQQKVRWFLVRNFYSKNPTPECIVVSIFLESRFINILTTNLKDSVGLCDQEINELSDYFKVQNGQIAFAQFCSVIHDNGIQIIAEL